MAEVNLQLGGLRSLEDALNFDVLQTSRLQQLQQRLLPLLVTRQVDDVTLDTQRVKHLK